VEHTGNNAISRKLAAGSIDAKQKEKVNASQRELSGIFQTVPSNAYYRREYSIKLFHGSSSRNFGIHPGISTYRRGQGFGSNFSGLKYDYPFKSRTIFLGLPIPRFL
jgi:hypothetical protein